MAFRKVFHLETDSELSPPWSPWKGGGERSSSAPPQLPGMPAPRLPRRKGGPERGWNPPGDEAEVPHDSGRVLGPGSRQDTCWVSMSGPHRAHWLNTLSCSHPRAYPLTQMHTLAPISCAREPSHLNPLTDAQTLLCTHTSSHNSSQTHTFCTLLHTNMCAHLQTGTRILTRSYAGTDTHTCSLSTHSPCTAGPHGTR